MKIFSRRFLWQVLLVVPGLSALTIGLSQVRSEVSEIEESTADYYAGFGTSFLLYVPILHAHFGFANLLAERTDLRLNLELFPYVYSLSADAIFQSADKGSAFSSYTGAGVRLIYFNDGYTQEFLPGAGAMFGARYTFDGLNLFGECEFNVVLAPSELRSYLGFPILPLPLLRLGVEFPF